MSLEQKSPPEIIIPSPPPQSTKPDTATRNSPFTKGDGDGQVLHFQKWGLSYGTDDKGHAAALILSLVLFVGLIIVLFVGSISTDNKFALEIAKIVGSAFLIVAGIAVGKSASKSD